MADDLPFLGDLPEEADTEPLASRWSLCGQGYHPDFEIDVGDEPTGTEYRWAHVICLIDQLRLMNAYEDKLFGDQDS